MHRAARSLTINTSNCLVNKFNSSSSSSSSSSSGGSGRPYTPPPPSCRLHKIYEEKLEVLGPLGYENWFDDNANPFYRHAEPELTLKSVVQKKKPLEPMFDRMHDTAAVVATATSRLHHPPAAAGMKPFRPSSQEPPRFDPQGLQPISNKHQGPTVAGDRKGFSNERAGYYDSFDSESDQDERCDRSKDGMDDTRGLGLTRYHDSSRLTFACDADDEDEGDDEEEGVRHLRKPKTELEYRRWSNRNRIMDRGQLMPDTHNMFLPLPPLTRESRLATLGGYPKQGKARALSPYPHSRTRAIMGN